MNGNPWIRILKQPLPGFQKLVRSVLGRTSSSSKFVFPTVAPAGYTVESRVDQQPVHRGPGPGPMHISGNVNLIHLLN